ncbi:hypothetical protein, partial [Aeromicrobium sp.]|uniref:hypothetical protein n=1 Tax=Aeromicrobium sp. TaxID=1871063 RepID=UPI0025C1B28A
PRVGQLAIEAVSGLESRMIRYLQADGLLAGLKRRLAGFGIWSRNSFASRLLRPHVVGVKAVNVSHCEGAALTRRL